jgi:hypothetical protein
MQHKRRVLREPAVGKNFWEFTPDGGEVMVKGLLRAYALHGLLGRIFGQPFRVDLRVGGLEPRRDQIGHVRERRCTLAIVPVLEPAGQGLALLGGEHRGRRARGRALLLRLLGVLLRLALLRLLLDLLGLNLLAVGGVERHRADRGKLLKLLRGNAIGTPLHVDVVHLGLGRGRRGDRNRRRRGGSAVNGRRLYGFCAIDIKAFMGKRLFAGILAGAIGKILAVMQFLGDGLFTVFKDLGHRAFTGRWLADALNDLSAPIRVNLALDGLRSRRLCRGINNVHRLGNVDIVNHC